VALAAHDGVGMPFFGVKHAVIETPTFLGDCAAAGLSEEGRHDIVDVIADDPTAGDLMPGTGGARKRRFRGRGRGKSGGYRGDRHFAGRRGRPARRGGDSQTAVACAGCGRPLGS
jgi:hypothetical protein